MYYLDSHIHLQDYKTEEVKNVVNNAIKNNVSRFINLSSHPQDWDIIQNLSQQYPQIIPAYGIHPWYINEASNDFADKLEYLLKENQNAMIGECGIDRLKNPDTSTQADILRIHISLANKYQRPLIIHSIKSNREFGELFSILPQRTVFHSFTGSAEWGREIQKHGFFLGINFSILRIKNAADIIRGINLDKILLETDGPYQNNIKSEESLPQNLPFLADKIAEMAHVNLREFLNILNYNQSKFLGE